MGDPSVEVSEESRDAAQLSKAKAMDALSEGRSTLSLSLSLQRLRLSYRVALLSPHSKVYPLQVTWRKLSSTSQKPS